MKNSPDTEWFNKVEKRLEAYSEEPDGAVWDKIAAALARPAEPVWIRWSHRSTAAMCLLIFLWAGMNAIHSVAPSEEEPEAVVNDVAPGRNGNFHADHLATAREPSEALAGGRAKSHQRPLEQHRADDHAWSSAVVSNTEEASAVLNNTDDNHAGVDDRQIAKGAPSAIRLSAEDGDSSSTKETIMPPTRRKRAIRLYVALSPSLSFQEITPLANDGFVVERFSSRPFLSADRLGVSIHAGTQLRVGRRLEIYGGLSAYRQSQTLVYQYLSDAPAMLNQRENFDYAVSPTMTEQSVRFAMLNLGAEAGVLYYLRGERLTQKAGAGLAWSHGTRRSGVGETYRNETSQYLLYQLLYRSEYTLSNSLCFFVQPFYQHSLISAEDLKAPFKTKPYRVGLSVGLFFSCCP